MEYDEKLVRVNRELSGLKCIVGFQPRDVPLGDRGFSVEGTAPVFESDLIPSPFPAMIFVEMMEQRFPERFWRVPLDGTKTELVFNFDCLGSPFHAATTKGRKEVFWVSLSLLLSYEIRSFSLDEGVHHLYASPGQRAVQVSSFETNMFGCRTTFEFQSNERDEILARLKFTGQ
ncbi:MAG: hypothetical protein ACLQVJ_06845 [Syntrophobacteraceae bacterium]